MAQVESNKSDPKLSKGGTAKKQMGKPTKDSVNTLTKQLKELFPSMHDDQLERVLEKNDYDIATSAAYLFEGNPIPAESSEWQQVTNRPTKEAKAKTEKDVIPEKKEKVSTYSRPESDKRNDRDRGDGRADRKFNKKPDARFIKQEGVDGAPEGQGYRGPRDNRDFKSNGSPNTQSRGPRRSSAPIHNGPKPAQNQQQQPQQPLTQTTPPSTNQHTWGPPGGSQQPAVANTAAPSAVAQQSQSQSQSQTQQTQPQLQSQSQTQSQPQPQPQATANPSQTTPPPSGRFNATTTATSYSKIVQGKPTPPPQPPQQQQANHPAAPSSTPSTSSATPSSIPPSAQGKPTDFQSPAGSRGAPHPSRGSPTWRPKDPNTSSTAPATSSTSSTPALATPAQSAPASTTSSAAAAATTAPVSASPVSLPSATPAAPSTSSQPVAQTQQVQAPVAAPAPVAQAAPAAQPAPVTPAQPAPISPPVTVTQKRQPIVVSGGNVVFPPSLQYADNLSIQFGSMGIDNNKPKDLVLNLGTQPTNTPAPAPLSQPTQPIQPPVATAQHHPASTTPPPQAPAVHQPQQPAHPQHHSPHSQHVSHTHPAHMQHIPTHLSQQQLHLNGDPMSGHIVQSTPEDIHGYNPYNNFPPYFHMPAFGFADGNPEDRRYYDHSNTASYGAPADASTAQSSVPQNSQSPPPNSSNQYPMPYYSYPSHYMHPYYQPSGPSQFQQFPSSYMYGYNRMGGAGGYPPHSSSSPAGQAHSQYDESEYNKYTLGQQPQSYSNFYPSSASSTAASTQGVQQSSVSKPAQSFSPTPAGGADGKDYKYNHRNDPSAFYNTMGQQTGSFNQHTHQPHTFIGQQHMGPQNPSSQSSAYHPQPLSSNVPVQNAGAQRSHYSGLP